LLRIAAAAPTDLMLRLALAAAVVWTTALGVWAVRYGRWYGLPRSDGRPG
jgi:uncharacterized protein involved in response to NO